MNNTGITLKVIAKFFITVLIFTLGINPMSYGSRYQSCIIRDFEEPERLQKRLDSGLYGEWNRSFQQQMITVFDYNDNATEFYTISKQPTDREPLQLVLFLHGFPEFAWAWEEQLAYFGEDYHAVAIDIKGHHYSSKPNDVAEYDYVKSAREIKELVNCLGYDTLTLVGHDFGGALSYSFASLYPEMLNGLIILNAPHIYAYGREYHNPLGDQKEMSFYIGQAQGTSLPQQLQFLSSILSDTSILKTGFYSGFRIFRIVGESWGKLSNWESMKNYYRSMYYPPNANFFQPQPSAIQKSMLSIHVPTMVLWGMKDPFLSSKLLDGLDEFIPDLELITFPQHTHWINHELKDLNLYIEDFINRHPGK